jgi:SnoaL-like polyketide cyclase
MTPEMIAPTVLGLLIGGGALDMSWFDRYVSAWLLHPVAGSPEGQAELKALLDCYSPGVRYEDVPTASVFDGHDGIKRMCDSAHILSSDLRFAVLTRQTNGRMFALETEFWGTSTGGMGRLSATGRKFTQRAVSVGTIDDQGLVAEHRDYWDLAGFLAQIGAEPVRG